MYGIQRLIHHTTYLSLYLQSKAAENLFPRVDQEDTNVHQSPTSSIQCPANDVSHQSRSSESSSCNIKYIRMNESCPRFIDLQLGMYIDGEPPKSRAAAIQKGNKLCISLCLFYPFTQEKLYYTGLGDRLMQTLVGLSYSIDLNGKRRFVYMIQGNLQVKKE